MATLAPTTAPDTAGLAPRPSLAAIFGVFLRLGITGFGGPAMIAVIRELSITKHRWVDAETFQDTLVLCQSIPGATAIQIAAGVGLARRGVPGALAAFAGISLPAFLLMYGLSAFYAHNHDIGWMVSLMRGLGVVVVALIGNAAWTFARVSARDWPGATVAAGAAVGLGLGCNPFLVICGAALSGLALYRHREPRAMSRPLGQALRQGLAQTLPLLLLLAGLLGAAWFFNPGLFDLARLLLGINCLSFAGGFAALPLLYHQIVDVSGLMSARMFMDGIALGQITPGPIIITATFLGYLLYGGFGAVVATVAMFAPSFLILTAVAPAFGALKGSRAFFRISLAIAASFVGLLAYVTARFALDIHWGPASLVLLGLTLYAMWRRIDMLYLIGFAMVYAMVLL